MKVLESQKTKEKSRFFLKMCFIMTCLAIALLGVLFVTFVPLTELYLGRIGLGFPDPPFLPTVILLYAAWCPAALAVVSLLLLLRNVRDGKVFCEKSIRLLRNIAYAAFGFSAVIFVMCIWIPLFLLVAFASLALGMIIAVVRSVIEEGTRIKEENDYTV